eukprot:SAG11_NODE_24897_length_366_cov_1.168539_1_plen_43_part_10
MIAQLPGIFANLLVGLLLEATSSWQIVFGISAIVQVSCTHPTT